MTLRLTARLTLAAAAIAVLPLVFAGASIGWLVRRELWRQRDAALIARAQTFGERVQSTILDPLARDNALRRWAADPELAGSRCDDALSRLHVGFIAAAAVLDPAGNVRCATTEPMRARYAKAGASGSAWFRIAREGGLATAGYWSNGPQRLVDVAVGLPGGTGVLVGAHRIAVLASMIDDAAKSEAGMSIVAGGAVLYGDLPADLFPSAEAKSGAVEGHTAIAGWARNDVSPSELGGDWTYVVSIPRAAGRAAVDSLVRLIAVLVVTAAVLASVAAWMLGSRMARPIRELGDAVEGIVEKGDLTRTVEVGGDDEIARVARAFSALVRRLREIPALLSSSTEALGGAVAELSAVAEQQRGAVERQSDAVTSAKSVSDSIREASRIARQRAQEVAGGMERTGEVGRAGESALSRTIEVLTESRDEVGRIAEQMRALKEATLRIGGIAETVKDLADQSNMLALNAAIEAVRSGEQGKGFAVVAREIRSLADQSIAATSKVREILAGVSRAIAAATGVAESGSRRVEDSLADIRASGEGLRELAALSVKSADGIRDLVDAVNEQDRGIGEVGSSLGGVTAATSEAQQNIAAIADAVRSLDAVARQISGIVGRFRV